MFKRNILLLALFLSLSLIFAQENSGHSELVSESVNNKTTTSENPPENPPDCKKQTFFVVNFPKNFEKKVLDYARIDNSFSTEKGILSNYLTISLSNLFDYLYGENFSAVQFTENSTSFIFENVFWLIRTYKIQNENPKLIFKLGATLYYNYEYLDFISSKHNLFYGINFEHNFRNLITSRGQVFCGNRFSHIFALGNEDPYIHNWDFQAKFEFIFHSTFKLDPYVSIASFEDFRYPLFCAPIFSLGVVYETNKNFNFGILGSVRYIDFFTLSSYIDSWVLKFYVEYKIDEVTNLFSKLMNGGS